MSNLSQCFDRILLDRLEDDQDKSWECTKVLEYREEIGI
jgi:hypothetical protein